MSSPNITVSTMSQSFAPKKEIPLTYGKSIVYVYPSITEGMPNAEKSYAFMMNKSAFATADIKIKTKIQAFANSLNSTLLANVVQAKFIEHATTYITSTGKFTVDSYHGRNGIIIPDCLDVDGDLRPSSGEAAANRRPEGIQYVKLSSDIKFTEVDDKNVQPYPFTFYVRLTMEDITVQDENQNDINLLTFHGEDEWATDTVQDEIDIVLKSQASIRKPFLLDPPSIADVSADASIEVTPGAQGLEKLALEAAWDYITQAPVFDKICPNPRRVEMTAMRAKELLPITIDPMLPHFMIGVGPVGQTPSISLLAAYDTAAVANIGWSDFHLAFAKKFPSAVKSITWAKDKYTPLTLSGVVTDDDKSKQEALCTSLPVVIEYYMPYQSKA
eukprot:scaffold98745_cov31-Attheya_sp.AAC.1